jgi:hypothetical protein
MLAEKIHNREMKVHTDIYKTSLRFEVGLFITMNKIWKLYCLAYTDIPEKFSHHIT